MFADSSPLRPFSATPEMIRNPNFVFPVKLEDSPSGSPIESRFARRSSVPHTLGPVPVIPAALESRPRSSGSAATLLAGVGILPPPPVIPTTSRSNSPVGNGPASPFNFGSGRPIAQRTSGLGAPNPVTIGPVPQVASRLRNASGVDGNGSETAAPSSAGEEKSGEKSLAPVNKTPMRRGHAHRRSGAVSSSDVWALMNASAPALSMPKDSPPPVSTPPPNSQPSPVVSWSAPVSPGLITPQKTPVLGPVDSSPSAPQDAAAKRAARVSFIEHVEIIPRPLSAASSQATVKGHFGGESISSLASFNSLVQPAFPTQSMSRTRSNSHSSVARFPPLVIPANQDRPSTAGAILNSPIDSPIEGLSRNGSLKRNVDTAITPTTPPPSKKIHKKAISEFALASFPKFSSDTTVKNTNANARISSEDDSTEGSSTPTNDEEKKKKKKKKSKGKGKGKNKENREDREEGQSKKNKKKGWGLGKKVLGKHPKNRQLKALPRRSPTPPLPRSASGERIGGAEWVAAWNESYVIVPPNFGDHSPSFLGAGESSPHSVESDSPIIDLDAALGPFKTPQNVRGNFRAAKRYMHSSGRPAGTFGGPSFVGLHKRSESLPETRMELFALDENEGMEMGDVFEEEDEDDSSSSSACSSAGDSEYQIEGIGIGINIIDVDGESTSSRRSSDATEEDVVRSAQGSRRGSASSTKSCKSLKSAQLKPRSSSHSMKIDEQPISPVMEEDEHLSPSPIIKKSREHFRVSIISSSTQSSTSTVTPTTLPVPDTPATSGNSPATSVMSLSTPYEDSSKVNNHSEIYLAASETGSGFLGEPSPDMRMSCDDVPSLTSCSSTMTGIVYREPATPGASESIKEGKSGKKSKKEKREKRWSRVFGFLKIKS